ncbi:MAG: hypothetical protein ACRETD_11290 [Steroidobacteraceae bacterium]
MSESHPLPFSGAAMLRPWDARLARRPITPLKDSWVTPNYLTTVCLCAGPVAAAAFRPGTCG